MTLRFASLQPLTKNELDSISVWLTEQAPKQVPPVEPVNRLLSECSGGANGPLWLLAHLDSGVVWGRVEGGWPRWARSADPAWPPAVTIGSMHMLRVFGPAGELLLWRDSETGSLAGRLLQDQPRDDAEREVWGPKHEVYIVAGTRLAPDVQPLDAHSTAIQEANGRQQIVPVRLDERAFDHPRVPEGAGVHALGIEIRHYVEDSPENGCVRIAASRLVRLRLLSAEERHATEGDT